MLSDDQKVKAVVIDGVTIGHPCCAHFGCQRRLARNKDRFCPTHAEDDSLCCVVGCGAKAVGSTRSCGLSEHVAAMKEHRERGTARFQLKAKLERAKMIQMMNSVPSALSEDAEERKAGEEKGDEVSDDEGEEPPEKEAPRIRVQACRKRTHNEQLFVAPCGVIIARETFYGAEAPATVIVC